MKLDRLFLASFLALTPVVGVRPAAAQDYDRPSPGYGDDSGGGYDRGGAGGAGGYERGGADTSDPGGVSVRVGKIESRIRDMTGQIEELQNANRKLVEQLQKFQADVDSRLSSSAGSRSKRSDATLSSGPTSPAADSESSAPKPVRKARHDDAYDPDDAPADAPGKPKPLGSPSSGQPDDGAPMDLSGGRLRRGASANPSDTMAPTLRLPTAPKSSGAAPSSNGPAVAAIAPTGPRAEFDLALGRFKDKQYEDAEKGFTTFIQKNPKSRLAADATYYLGESFAQRGRNTEAVEQYYTLLKNFSTSVRAPDAMLRLGVSLRNLGAKEQACAAFNKIGQTYPNAPAYVKSGAEREAKRAQC